MSLSTTQIGDPQAPHALVMLHGIYGRGRNWQAIAKAVTAARRDYSCVLVDLPHHGDSPAGRHGDTVRGLAEDLDDWLTETALQPRVVLGHSFGGKVALALAERHPDWTLQTWVIDSTPAPREAGGSAYEMLQLIARLPDTFPSREAAADALVDGGYTRGVAVWMATNLSREGDAFVWRLDFAAMRRLLDNFFDTDLWPVVDNRSPTHELHFLKASTSSAMSESAAAHVEALNDADVHLHRRDGTHWIHAESPQTVIDLLVTHLP